MYFFLIGVVVGIAISAAVSHWDAVGPVLSRLWQELRGMFGR